MESNPWQVECIEVFCYFICPECPFLTKETSFFQDHAEENHPLSHALFSPNNSTHRAQVGTKIKELEYRAIVSNGGIDETSNQGDSLSLKKSTKMVDKL